MHTHLAIRTIGRQQFGRRPARGGHTVDRRALGGAEQDDPVGPPRPMRQGKRGHVADGDRGAARKVDAFQLGVGEKGEGAAVGRPEHRRGALGSGHGPCLEIRHRPQPHGAAIRSGDERELRAIRRQGEERSRRAPGEGSALGRKHEKANRRRGGSRARRRTPVNSNGGRRRDQQRSA